jgi:WD40 repeat protein/serine/threonine protein kinase
MKTACPACGQQYINLPQIADNKMTTCTVCKAQFVIRDPVGKSLAQETNVKEWQVDDVILNLYVVKEVLGQGGFGKVFRLFHQAWELDLAVKTPNQRAIAAAGGVENFEREAETWVNLGLHPHTVSCYYVRRIDNIPRVFSEYVSGGDLSGWIKTGKLYEGGKKKALKRMIDIAIQFAWGLHYAHEQKLIHQDVKPANLMLTPEETAKVTDFGLARAKAMSDMHSGGDTIVVKGSGYTPEYASPEQISGSKLTRRTDIWSWAVSILEMFYGERTWRSGTVAGYQLETYLNTGSGRKDLPTMPATLGNLLRECLREDPEQRPHNLLQVSETLIEIYQKVSGRSYPRKPSSAGRDTADSLNNRAISMLDLGRDKEAEATWHRALNIQAYHPETTYNRGLTHWQQGSADDESLILDMEKAVQMSQPEWLGRLLLARIHLQRGDCESALDVLGDVKDQEVTDISYKGIIRRASDNLQKSRRRLSSIKDRWPVRALAFGALGKTIISGGLNRSVDIWDPSSGVRTASIKGHAAPISSLVVTSDGSRAFTGSLNAEVRLWNLHKKQLIKTYKDHLSAVTCMTLSQDNELLLTGSEDQAIHISTVQEHTHLQSLQGHRDTISSIAIDVKNQRVLSASHDHTLRLWEIDNGACLHVLQDHTDKVNAACLTSNNQYAISGSSDKTIKIWNLLTGKCLHTLSGNTSPITAMALSRDDQYLLTGNQRGTLKLWDLANRRCVSSFIHAHQQAISAIAFYPGSYRAATAGLDKTINLWDMTKGFDYQAPVVLSKIHSSEAVQTSQEQFNSEIDSALTAIANDKPIIAASHIRKARALPGYANAAEAVNIWRRLYTSLHQNKLTRIWEQHSFSGHEGSIHSVSLNMNGTLALSGGEDKSVRLWDITTGKCTHTFTGHEDIVTSVAMTRCGRYAISASNDTTLKLWNIESSANQITYKGHQKSVTCLAPSPNSRYLFSGSRDKTLKLWDLHHGRILRTYNGHSEAVTSCWVSPDGQYALSGSEDRTIRLWDIASGDSLITIGTFKGISAQSLLSAPPMICVMHFPRAKMVTYASGTSNVINASKPSGDMRAPLHP